MFNFAIDLHVSLKAERLFMLGPLRVTNSMLLGLVTSVLFVVFMLVIAKKTTVRPKAGIVGTVEVLVEFITGLIESPLGSRERAVRYTPYFSVFFFFIVMTNLLALLPVVGPALSISVGSESVPLLRPFTADLNGTIALAVIAVAMVQYISVKEQGFKHHIQHYFTNKPLNPMNFFIGLLEVFGELMRVVSLSLRLFLNTAVGEILVLVFTSIVVGHGRTPFAVLPILLFELMVAVVQAYVYVTLCATYLGITISHVAPVRSDSHDMSNREVVSI